MLHLRAFGLTLLAHLVFVLGGSLILLKRLRNVLGCLVGQTVMVDCLLRLDSSATVTRGSLSDVSGFILFLSNCR